MSNPSCPSCGTELKFLNTSLIKFDGFKVCVNCFQRATLEKLTTLEQLKSIPAKVQNSSDSISFSKPESRTPETIIVKSETKGFGFVKACIGFFLAGPFGLLCGFCGSGKTKTTVIRK
ncbi:hypothetical protein EHQ43_17495 [Leptospira bouyouniensis]|uniref:Uncharacterized protein n=1 Tax=Leptospira bouyouniensis TaxID=2484911 RepID=A0A7I0IKK7_9LEPT|nr:hypothetical protein [Leptospira bouyouniensis]TGL03548.1 hypothetical protein EHQ43_17495 [Leptospira bouyouniensis]